MPRRSLLRIILLASFRITPEANSSRHEGDIRRRLISPLYSSRELSGAFYSMHEFTAQAERRAAISADTLGYAAATLGI